MTAMSLLIAPARPYRAYLVLGGVCSTVFGLISFWYADQLLFARPITASLFVLAGVLSLATSAVWRLPVAQVAAAAALVACIMRASSWAALWSRNPSWALADAFWLWLWITGMTVFIWGVVVLPRGILHALELEEARRGSP